MAQLIHGGDLCSYRLAYGREPLDFSANCNPLGVPEGVIAAIEARGYREITIGVEDENTLAKHIYAKFGFTEFVERRSESYQGDSYEYDLLLRRS